MVPLKAVQVVIQYYTIGTIYSNTNIEFKNSLWKNICLSINAFLIKSVSNGDIALFVHKPIPNLFKDFGNHPLVQNLKNYGVKYTSHSYWLVKNEIYSKPKKNVLIYLHGGGYAIGLMGT